eukprot:TRINITY_DN12395_c0_g1_i1.p1 TRINITY_DN12395_c0_g1~~TRINITY_DN12395_c0_g1_i1.p1  ORF type:complete len:202 (+),score=47.47 TRINITY_DN12395_c0_g1_i1:366-971(+)
MAGPMKIIGIREIFDQVNRNNEGVKELGLAGTVDDLIYVRIRGKVVGPNGESRLAWGAGPISTWDRLRKAKMVSKPGEYSNTFLALYELVKELKPALTTDEFKRQLWGKRIAIDHRWVDIEDLKTICEIFDPEYVTYKGGRKPPRVDRLECLAKREFADMSIDLNQKHDTSHLEEKKTGATPTSTKRGKIAVQVASESTRK